jgi:hypothetical protein
MPVRTWPRAFVGLALAAAATATVLAAPSPALAAAPPLPADVTALSTPYLDSTGLFVVARGTDNSVVYGVRGINSFPVPAPDFVSIGGQTIGDPTGALIPGGALILIRGTDNQAYFDILGGFAPRAAAFQPIPGLLISSEITAVRLPFLFNGQLVRIFARGLEDGAVYTNMLTVDGWTGWVNLGGFATSEIAAALTPGPSSPFSDFRLAVRGGDNRVYSMVLFNNLTSTGWAPVGNQTITGNIAIIKDADPLVPRGNEIFVRDARTGAVVGFNFDTQAWVNLGGVANSDLAVSTIQDGSTEVYVRGTTQKLYINRRPPGSTQFAGYVNLGGIVTNNPVSSGSFNSFRDDSVIDEVIVRGTNGLLFNRIETANLNYEPYASFPGSVVA